MFGFFPPDRTMQAAGPLRVRRLTDTSALSALAPQPAASHGCRLQLQDTESDLEVKIEFFYGPDGRHPDGKS
jgi:hypothetical protein